jgi:serine/threonine-protein kinase haspin
LNPRAAADNLFMDDVAHGVQATIIDLGLSRMDATDTNGCEKVYWTPFEEEVFMGEGLLQFCQDDVYLFYFIF